MTVEPSEWHSFGDPEGAAGAPVAPVSAPVAARQAPKPNTASLAASHRNTWLAVGATIIAAVVGVAVFVATIAVAGGGDADQVVIAAREQPGTNASTRATSASARPAAQTSATLLVDVEGAVRSPGLHRVPAGSRIGDAITAAGGYADRADLTVAALTLNLAEPLADGAKIRVPVLGDVAAAGPVADGAPGSASQAPAAGAGSAGTLIDLNHADEAALESLPGIGPVTAGKIVAVREGDPFASLDDVVGRKALSQSILDKIRSLVTVTP